MLKRGTTGGWNNHKDSKELGQKQNGSISEIVLQNFGQRKMTTKIVITIGV